MNARYAEGTSVSTDRSRVELERVLERYGANGFGYAWDTMVEVTPAKCSLGQCNQDGRLVEACLVDHSWQVVKERRFTREVVAISFRFKDRRVRLDVPMPAEHELGTKAKLDAATRQRWRALVLVVKAKLEAVASGISTLESEFL